MVSRLAVIQMHDSILKIKLTLGLICHKGWRGNEVSIMNSNCYNTLATYDSPDLAAVPKKFSVFVCLLA